MRIVAYSHPGHGSGPRLGLLQGDRVVSFGALIPDFATDDLLAQLDRGPAALDALGLAGRAFEDDHRDALVVPPTLAVPVWESRLLPPLPRPRSLRDFYAFEAHVRNGHAKRGRPVPPAWYEAPVFYFGHVGGILGPDDEVVRPAGCRELDFELELACVVGRPGRDLSFGTAEDVVAGFLVMNDWSARDVQRREMSVGLGPAKGKDFATSLGPALVTPDELADRRRADGRLDLAMVTRLNGEEIGRGNAADMHWTWGELIAHASAGVDLVPGDVIGSGTVGGGCLLEGDNGHPWLEPGDEVELEVERVGRLRNRVATPA